MSTSAAVDPHDKMRARDVNKVARGEQAPRPAHEYGTVSPPPPPSSTQQRTHTKGSSYQTCYEKYVEYHRCISQKGEKAPECNKLDTYVRSSCPTQWIAEWDRDRLDGKFPEAI